MNIDLIVDKHHLSFARASALLEADPIAGTLRWKPASGRHGLAGATRPAEPCNYRNVVIDGRGYKAHRLMWLLCTGAWPEFVVDHINGDRHDNRLANLRDVPHAENQRNQSFHRAGARKSDWRSATPATTKTVPAARVLRVMAEVEA